MFNLAANVRIIRYPASIGLDIYLIRFRTYVFYDITVAGIYVFLNVIRPSQPVASYLLYFILSALFLVDAANIKWAVCLVPTGLLSRKLLWVVVCNLVSNTICLIYYLGCQGLMIYRYICHTDYHTLTDSNVRDDATLIIGIVLYILIVITKFSKILVIVSFCWFLKDKRRLSQTGWDDGEGTFSS